MQEKDGNILEIGEKCGTLIRKYDKWRNKIMRAEFDETLVTGNDMIDSQHKELMGGCCWR